MSASSWNIAGGPTREVDERLARSIESYRTYLRFVASRIRDGSPVGLDGTSDLVQQSMLSALGSIRDGRARLPELDDREVRAWLRRILINTHRDQRRHDLAGRRSPDREERDPDFDPPADSTSPESKAVVREETERLARARLGLDERDRQLLAWWFEDGLTFTEIGERMGCSVSGARKACRKAAERLKAAFERGPSA